MLDLGVILIAHIEEKKAISGIENTIENTEFLILARRYMLLVPLVTTLTGSFWKQEVKTRKKSNLEYTETWMDDVRLVSLR